MSEAKVSVDVTREELALLDEALDSYAYWQLGRELPRSDGEVFIPGDFMGEVDRYWEDRLPNARERVAVAAIVRTRALQKYLLRAAVQRER